ncbi:hypothetical protein F4810DRAFT_715666 [Camillea tinctor]|nr:hypothetical protein F4810DRAFT_715666 [Camillea tinctor]
MQLTSLFLTCATTALLASASIIPVPRSTLATARNTHAPLLLPRYHPQAGYAYARTASDDVLPLPDNPHLATTVQADRRKAQRTRESVS